MKRARPEEFVGLDPGPTPGYFGRGPLDHLAASWGQNVVAGHTQGCPSKKKKKKLHSYVASVSRARSLP